MFEDVNHCEMPAPECPSVASMAGGELGLTEEIQLRLLALGEQLRQHAATIGNRHGFTPQQALLLFRLNAPQTMGQIAGALDCDPSNVTGMSSRLEVRGLVQRVPDPSDRRTKWLTLTDAGRSAREALWREMFAESEVLAPLDDGQRETLATLLRVITAEVSLTDAVVPCADE